MDPNENPPGTQTVSNPPRTDGKFFVSEKEVDEFWNRERGRIRQQEEDKVKDKLTDLRKQLETKGDTSMTEEQLAKTVRSILSEVLDPKLNEFNKGLQDQQKKLEQKVNEDAKQRKIERLQDILATERGRYQEDELIEDLLPVTLTGDESPDEIRATVKKAHEAYVKATSKFKKEENPPAGQQQQQNPPAGDQQQQQQNTQQQNNTQAPNSNGNTQAPAGTVAAPGLNNSAANENPPILDQQSEEQRLLDEMNEITDPKEWEQKRHKFGKVLGTIR